MMDLEPQTAKTINPISFQAWDTQEYHIIPITPQHFQARGAIPFKHPAKFMLLHGFWVLTP